MSLRLLLLTTLAAAVAQASLFGSIPINSGRPYPKMPQEFAATMMQQKWNTNGYNINHTCSGSYYSSFSRMKIRADCSDFPLTTRTVSSQNRSLADQFGQTEISVMDFGVVPATTTIFSKRNISDRGSCVTYNASWLPPTKSSFLKDVNAVFVGDTPDPHQRGRDIEQWAFDWEGIAFLFYFDTKFRHFVGYSFTHAQSSTSGIQQTAVGVWTQFINVWGTDDASLFNDDLFANECPA